MEIKNIKTEFELNKICRCCMAESEQNMDISEILSVEGSEITLETMLMESCCVQFAQLHLLSPTVCGICVERISSAYLFKKQCERTEQLFLELYSNFMCNQNIKEENTPEVRPNDGYDPYFDDVGWESIDSPEISEPVDEVDKKFNCSDCGKSFKTQLKLTTHQKNHYPQYTECKICSKTIKRSALKRHEKTHNPRQPGSELYYCETCGKGFTEEKNLNRHRISHTTLRPFECDICGKNFTRSDILQQHKKSHGEKEFHCDKCSAAFISQAFLNMHMKKHLEAQSDSLSSMLKCEICGAKFKQKIYYQVHLKIEHGQDVALSNEDDVAIGNFGCTSCDKTYRTKSGLYQHQRLIHTELKIITDVKKTVCPVCGKAYYASYMPTHMRYHTGDKPYDCKMCGKNFANKLHLQIHLKTHLGIKPHLCRLCGKKFTRRAQLRIHLRTHSGEKPYKCDKCERAFAQVGDLTSHKRTHTGEKPFVCKLCPSAYTQSSALRGHERRAHGKS